jgi:hypothetical protein
LIAADEQFLDLLVQGQRAHKRHRIGKRKSPAARTYGESFAWGNVMACFIAAVTRGQTLGAPCGRKTSQ